MRCNNLHILLALTGSMALAACGGKAGDTGDTGLSFAGETFPGGGTRRVMRCEHFDSDEAIQLAVVTFQHDAHPGHESGDRRRRCGVLNHRHLDSRHRRRGRRRADSR